MESLESDWCDEWDENFLEQATRVAEQAFISSSSSPIHSPPRHLSQKSSHLLPHRQNNESLLCSRKNYNNPPADYSPPRELLPHHEIDSLKKELRRVSEQLSNLEKECVYLKKDRDNKEEQLRLRNVEHMAVFEDRLQFQNASTSFPMAGIEAMGNHRTSSSRPILERVSNTGINGIECIEVPSSCHQPRGGYGPKWKNVQADGVDVTTDLRRRALINSGSTERSFQKSVLPEATTQPKHTKAVGVQTETDDGSGLLIRKNDFDSQHDLFNKLQAIWGLPSREKAGKSLVSKLFVMCAADIYALFRCMGMSMPVGATSDSLADLCFSDAALNDKLQHVHSAEAAKVARLYIILTKINNEMMKFEVLIDALLDLCTLDNVVFVYRSLRIMCIVLQQVLGWDTRSYRRDNVVIEGMCENKIAEIWKSQKVHTGDQFAVTRSEASYLGDVTSGTRSVDFDILSNKDYGYPGNVAFVSALDWFSLFEMIHQIAIGNKVECIQVEALSVMNIIVMRSNPCSERETFGSRLLFESLSKLLCKSASLHVQKQAVRLLYLLLNCPKILVSFCSACKDDPSSEATDDATTDGLTFQVFSNILEGLAECVKCRGRGTQELKLRTLAIVVLAFVASSGKLGFEVFLNPKMSNGANFLELILQALASELDAEAVESAKSAETCRERNLLVREALILLNRLASSPTCSSAIIHALTSSRDMISLTVDVVSRTSRKGRAWWKSDSTKKRKAEDEIVELARVFRSRVFASLGNP
ncbi:hypothetical protein IFM89_022990 [Coptis chinensis]|uniref:Uncharacterized protein n=1 Tax=Coptis chinensis TaxID=261450 RepID=A0A835M691_9MAGN|nr:hypothetical protein IFM89_022990 [Coptis chinensis]